MSYVTLDRIMGAHFGGHLFIVLLLATTAPGMHAESNPYFLTEVLARSEPNSIMDAIHGWKGPYQSGKRQYAWSWFEMGVKTEHWGIGIVHRQDYDLRFSKDAAELYGAITNDQPLETGRIYQADVKAHAAVLSGIRISRRDALTPTLRLECGLSMLQGSYLIEGSLNGQGIAEGSKSYTYVAQTDYAYTKDILFDRDVPPKHGYGVALDAKVNWQIHPQWRMEAQLRDLAAGIWWRNLPYTQAQATSARVITDGEGYSHWDPLISGKESNHRLYRQNLPTRGRGEIYYESGTFSLGMGTHYQFGDWLPRAGMGLKIGDCPIFAWYSPRDRAVGLESVIGHWKLGLSMDNLCWDKAQMIGLTLAYR